MSDASENNSTGEQLVMRSVAIADARSPELTVLDDVNWTVRARDYWVIGGLQASGKSLLLATAGGITLPQSGELHLFGRSVADLTPEERDQALLRIGLVFESGGGVFTRLTVAENVALPLRYHRNWSAEEAAPFVAEFLEQTGLTASADLLAGRISRAARHRVLLARALVTKPEVLLLDNPLVRLDPRETAWCLNFLQRLSSGHPLMDGRPVTLVVTAEDLRPWRDHGRQFGLLNQGRLNCLGGREQVAQCREPLLWELLAESAVAT